jgi:serine/threonine protein kinase
MQVSIKGTDYVFEPENVKWQIKRDEYAFVQFGELKCFAKRYKGNPPSGWGLMISMKNKKADNIPTVYDAIEVISGTNKTYYVFIEFISGCTLKEYILNGDIPNPSIVFTHLFKTLNQLHENGYWFSDFNEENIFVGSGLMKKFYLIDTDSCWSKDILPSHIPNARGGLPGASQNIGRFVLDYYKTYLPTLNIQNYNQLKGANFNHLQLLVLISKLCTYKNNKAVNAAFLYIRATSFKSLHKFIYNKNSSYSNGLFMIACKPNVSIKEPTRVMAEHLLSI